jgi:hypothetical protein
MTTKKQTLPNKQSVTKKPYTYVYSSHSLVSVSTPNTMEEHELAVESKNGKVQGHYKEAKNGKQVVNKEFKSQRGLDSIIKTLKIK